MFNKVLFSSNSNEWTTPQDFYDKLNNEFNFTLDPCATKEMLNAKSIIQKKKMDWYKIGAMK